MANAFHDLTPEQFPFTVEAQDRSGRVVWSQTVAEPGALYVPPLADTYGPVSIRVAFADGEVVEVPPP